MPFSVCLRLDPVFADTVGGGPVRVRALRPSFTLLGAALTKAERDAKVTASIEFVARLTSSVRDRPKPEEFALGALKGQLELSGTPPAVTFFCDAASLEELVQDPTEEPSDNPEEELPEFTPRSIELQLEEPFAAVEVLGGRQAKLNLPKTAGKFRYLEVVAKLNVGGGVEADVQQNDVLDVLILPKTPEPYPFSL